jgi:hypothetical protein
MLTTSPKPKPCVTNSKPHPIPTTPKQEELDEVEGQLTDQRNAALNHKAMATSLKGEKDILDKLVAQSQVCASFVFSLSLSFPPSLRRSLGSSRGSCPWS